MLKCWSCLLLVALWICFKTHSVSDACSFGNYGLNCSYTCHCTADNCYDITGCSDNCEEGWSGSKCTKENVALRKTAYQSVAYKDAPWNISLKAVDGNNNQDNNYCLLTDVGHQYTWWEVDLGRDYYIHQIVIYFREGYVLRKDGVKVYRSLSGNQSNKGHLCGSTNSNSPIITHLTCDGTARYITLYRDKDDSAMDFCEVQVFVCDAGTFGDDCSQFCHCVDGPCNHVTGKCTRGCKENWTGQTCSVCDSRQYGPLCERACSSRHCDESNRTSSCNNMNGKCDFGCTPGWFEMDCTKECLESVYGSRCAKQCSQRKCIGNSSCHHVTGKCDVGCDRGYQGEDCKTMCPSRKYGFNCNRSCEARKCSENSACDRFNGTCVSGCLKSWELPDCITECHNNTFGPSCMFKCSERHCQEDNSKCDIEDGVCQNGCQTGWKNANCTETCDSGSYGLDCIFDCNKRHCQTTSASCNHVNGSCGGGCENNYKGIDCTGCEGKYGPECSSSCSTRHCKDDNAPCDHMTGSCDGLCDAGYQGDACADKCASGTYGDNCTMSCSTRKCEQSDSCPHEDGKCVGGCIAGYQGVDCLKVLQQTTGTSNTPLIGSVVGAVVVVIIVTVIIVVFLRRRKTSRAKNKTDDIIAPENDTKIKERKYGAAEGPIYVNAVNSTENLEVNETNVSSVVPVVDGGEPEYQQTDEEEEVQDPNTYYNADQPAPPPFNLPEEGFDVSDLEGIIESIRNQPGGFDAEYLKLPSGFKHPYTDSQIPDNRCKNRFAGYYPYNNNRVKLSLLPNIPHSDYINASYVDAYGKPNYFIASQAPNKVTLPDFWRMIWEQDCGQIVMLTNLVEAGKHKCEPYWKETGLMNVGYFDVVVKDITERADYTIRKIQVTQRKSKKCKTFDHYHFTSWPDHGVPKVLDLLEFFWLTRVTPPSRPGPVLVHCSAGIGRTGTYIALHILTDEINKTGRMNVLGVMTKIRDQRKNMVQTKSQYECIFTTMLEVAKYGHTGMTTSDYTQKYAESKGSLRMGRKTLDELAEVIASTDTSDKGTPLANKLWVDGKDDLFVVQAPSKMLCKGYLLAYTPQRTENLLWKLIMENDSLTLVTLGNKKDTKFTPSPSHSSSYGNATVTSVTETSITNEITLRMLNVEMKGSDEKKEIANFSVRSWTNTSNTSTVISCLTTLTEQILDRQNNLKFHPVTVVFDESDRKKGMSLCILNNIMSAVSLDKRVEIFNNVRRLQSVLPSVHLSVHDFKLFSDLPFAHLESTGVYANM